MDGEILDTVTEWGSRPVADGVTGLHDLADEEFSGAVTDGSAWTFVLNGRYLGVFDGDIGDFEDASLTAYTAPDISLPLLYAMQSRGGETRGQYYSNETPLGEIDDTLSAGSFVGYVELSENVLSGDYYVVYYGGRSLPVAYVGNSRRLLTGDEAFERAADEVGIYSVVDADIEVVDLPERPDSARADDTETGAPSGAAVAADGAETGATAEEGVGDVAFDEGTVDSVATNDDPETTDSGVTAADGTADADDGTGTTPDWTTPAVADPDDPADSDHVDEGSIETETEPEPATADTDTTTTDTDTTTTDTDTTTTDDPGTVAVEDAGTVTTEDVDVGVAQGAETGDRTTESAEAADAPPAEPSGAEADPDSVTPDQVVRLRRELEAARAEKAEAEAERERIERERDESRATVERLRNRVEELEAELERLDADAAGSAAAAAERTLTRDEALSGTNLFVRYEDKTEGTLERAAEGRIDESTLRANLRIDYHTEFETTGLSVDGQPFGSFLRATPEHRFAEWLLTAVTYEIRRTDTRAELSKLYEAIERVDRIDLDGEVDVTADGRADTTTESFDVVFRNKMGDPLFVAAFEDGRDPTGASVIESLLDRTRRVSDAEETLAAAFFVTTSYFDADAMEVAVDATRGGLFSRSSRRSYVKLSRKSGFHLGLVEARDEDFFLTVPDL